MARLLGPDANSRLVYSVSGSRLVAVAGKLATVYADAGGTALASIATYDPATPTTPGAVISGSTLTVDAFSLLPLFWFPDGADKVWVTVDGGPLAAVNADYDARLDTTAGGILASLVDAKGDLLAATADNTVARLAVGADGKALLADSSQPTGLKWGSAGASYRGAWAAATAYSIGDLVTLGGELLYCATAHTSGATFSLTNWNILSGWPGRFNVKLYGAEGDGVTDDTAAINAAIAAGYAAGVANGTYWAKIHFPPGEYLLSSPTIKGGASNGNAQIALPFHPTTDPKFVLELTGTPGAEAWAHWEQTVASRSGVVLKTTLTGQTIDGTWGAPSVIGGPTVSVGSGVYNNLRIVVDGITVMAPHNPSLVAFDFKFLAQARVINAGAVADAGVVGSPNLGSGLTDTIGMALRMPQNGNNDESTIVNFGAQGFYYGVTVAEHFTALRLAIVFANVALFIQPGGGNFHGATITNLSVESVDIAIQTAGSGESFPIDIAQLSVEQVNTWDIDDANGNLRGSINYACSDVSRSTPRINGGSGIRVVSVVGVNKPGNAAAPAVPASTTALTNPFARDAAVVVTGGTVSAVEVDGVAQGYTATGFTVIVPAGKTITLTYTVAPTWTWTLL